MDIIAIENLSAKELEERGPEIIASLSKDKPEALPARYISALYTAKVRDETMADQGKTITTLRQSLDSQKTSHDDAMARLAKLEQRAQELENSLKSKADQLAKTEESLAVAVAEVGKLGAQETRDRELIDAAEKRHAEDQQAIETLKDALKKTHDELRAQIDVSSRLRDQATRHSTALTAASKALNDAIQADLVEAAGMPEPIDKTG